MMRAGGALPPVFNMVKPCPDPECGAPPEVIWDGGIWWGYRCSKCPAATLLSLSAEIAAEEWKNGNVEVVKPDATVQERITCEN